MKKITLVLAIVLFGKSVFAQNDIAQIDASVTPAAIGVGQTSDIKFSVSNVGSGTNAYGVGGLKVILSLPSKSYNFQSITSPANGAYFNWTYDTENDVIIGINHTAVPVGAIERDITIRVIGATPGKASSNLNMKITDGSDNTSISNDPAIFTLEVKAAAPLPVRLISFSGKPTANGNELAWKASNEKGFSHYEVEKSQNAKSFTKIGTVKGAINTNETLNYTYLDASGSGKLPGAVVVSNKIDEAYYRLRMVDLDGSGTYSKVIVIQNELKQSIVSEIYPNPSIGKEVAVQITSNENTDWTITSTDFVGRVISIENKRLNVGDNKIKLKLDPSHSNEIIYKFENADGFFTRKLIRQ